MAKSQGRIEPGEKQAVISDEKLVQNYREERAAGIWPSLQASDAVLRALDAAEKLIQQYRENASRVVVP